MSYMAEHGHTWCDMFTNEYACQMGTSDHAYMQPRSHATQLRRTPTWSDRPMLRYACILTTSDHAARHRVAYISGQQTFLPNAALANMLQRKFRLNDGALDEYKPPRQS